MVENRKAGGIFNSSLNRRQFLKSGAMAASAGALGVGGPGCATRADEESSYPDIPENQVQLQPNGRSVLILGGGFGGMHAACELLDRGFAVTIIEKSNMLGGKLKSWRDPLFGIPPTDDPNWKGYPRDHGAHAVWGFYNNLREFMGRHGYRLWRFPRESTMYNFIDKDGTQAELGYAPTWPGVLADAQRAQEFLKALSDMAGQDIGLPGFLTKMLSFDFYNKKQRMFLDGLTLPQWARSAGIPEILINKFFGPLSEMALFDHIDHTSALYTLMLTSLAGTTYQDMCIDIFMHPPGETYVSPIERYIKSKGGRIIYDTPVIKLNLDGDRIKSVLAGDEGYIEGIKSWKCNICGSSFPSPSKPGRCPTCGAHFSQIRVLAAGPPKEHIADYYVVAMDTPGAQEVVAKSGLLGDTYFDNIMKLEATGVYIVNLWYGNCNAWQKRFPRHVDFFPSGFKFLGITLNWAHDGTINGAKVCETLVPDYQGKNINVIETQVANTHLIQNKTDDEIARLVHEELKVVMPDLPAPTDYYVNRWDTYSPQRVGYEALRPPIPSPIDNLLFIGDWVKTDHQSVYMEKTNVSSKMVTNLLLDKIGQKKGRIKILKSGHNNLLINLVQLLERPYP